jgi:hypothetical protein
MPMIHHMLRESRGPSMAAGRLSAARESRACDRCGVFDADKGPAAAETHCPVAIRPRRWPRLSWEAHNK